MHATGHQPGNVRHVGEEERADLVGDAAERREVEHPRVRRATGDEQLRAHPLRDLAHLVVVDQAGVGPDAVGMRLPDLAGVAHRRAVGEVPAVRQREAEDGGSRRISAM